MANNDLSGKHEPPGPSTEEAVQRLIASILSGPLGLSGVGGLEGSWKPKFLSRDPNEVLQGVVSPRVKALRAPMQAQADETLVNAPKTPAQQRINSRGTIFHNTDLLAAEDILNSGFVEPRTINWKGSFLDPGKQRLPDTASLTRNPNIAIPSEYRDVAFEIDPEKIPHSKVPSVEKPFGKTTEEGNMNPYFESELRVPGKVPAEAIKMVHIMKDKFDITPLSEAARRRGIPVRVWPSPKEFAQMRIIKQRMGEANGQ